MTQPVQEPTQGRMDNGQVWRTSQLFRRPSPGVVQQIPIGYFQLISPIVTVPDATETPIPLGAERNGAGLIPGVSAGGGFFFDWAFPDDPEGRGIFYPMMIQANLGDTVAPTNVPFTWSFRGIGGSGAGSGGGFDFYTNLDNYGPANPPASFAGLSGSLGTFEAVVTQNSGETLTINKFHVYGYAAQYLDAVTPGL